MGRPAGVPEIFAPVRRDCTHCGSSTVTAARSCPECGALYVARRAKPLQARRVRLALAAAVLVLLAVLAGAVILLAPGIESAKRSSAGAARSAGAAAQRALRRAQAAEQRLVLATGHSRDPGPGGGTRGRLAARSELVRELERAITADARGRVRHGTLTGPILSTSCSAYPKGSPAPQGELSGRIGAYDCLAVNAPIRTAKGVVGELGDPFWARVDFVTGGLAWCKINPRPGEEAIGAGTSSVPLAPACDLSRPAPVRLP